MARLKISTVKPRKRAVKLEKRSVCPIACTLDVLGDKWTLLIVRDMLCGKARYKDFLRSPERIATNILADRLERLVEHRLVAAAASTDRVGSAVYELTARGRGLFPVLEAIRDWGLSNIKGTAAMMKPAR